MRVVNHLPASVEVKIFAFDCSERVEATNLVAGDFFGDR